MSIETFEVSADHFAPRVSWTDGDRNYHFWLKPDGTLADGVLHSNPVNPEPGARSGGHRASSLSAKKWASTIESMLAKIEADDLLTKARTAVAAKKRAAEEDRQNKIDAERLERLQRAMDFLPEAAREQIEALVDRVKLEFVAALEERI